MKLTINALFICLLLCRFLQTQAQDLPENKWIEVFKGSTGLKGPGKFHWISDMDAGVLWPVELKSGHGHNSEQFAVFSPKEKNTTIKIGSMPPKYKIDAYGSRRSPWASVYLPTLKKILFLQRKNGYLSKGGKDNISSWFLDPQTGKWEIAVSNFWMTEKSKDQTGNKYRDGRIIPYWGNLVYDAHNKEALSFGGGGTWGRTSKKKISVKKGDWILDDKKQFRRILADDAIKEAIRWFPAHCGTWLFSESSKKWTALKQPLQDQPSARLLPAMAYDSEAKKIILFGGDDLAKCLDDTWLYDCENKIWEKIETKNTPPALAGQLMVYVPEHKVILMTGGYKGGWRNSKETWIFELETKTWSKLSLDLPAAAAFSSGGYDPKSKTIYFTALGNKKIQNIYALKLNLSSVAKSKMEQQNKDKDYHSVGWSRVSSPLPGKWPGSKTDLSDRLKKIPANTWAKQKTPLAAPVHVWGTYIYDVNSHKGFGWGGGHSTYPGAEINTYDLISNRWTGMADATNYNPRWLHGMVSGPSGVSFSGWALLPSHARKSYGVDPISNTVVTYGGDIFDIQKEMFVKKMQNFPVSWGGPSTQVAYVTASHGLYAYSAPPHKEGTLCKANVKDAKWEIIAKGGPKNHREYCYLCYDPKRDRLMYFYRDATTWAFDFKTKTWQEEKANSKLPLLTAGDATYIPEMDAILTVHSDKVYFYKLAEKKWYSAPYVGDKSRRKNKKGRDHSPIYDPKYKVVIRFSGASSKWMDVIIMRLDPSTLKLTEVNEIQMVKLKGKK
ncbi:MAG: hypothetical protein COA79_09570 [Planctomycetota bacterium]|nr:MAG: hypothetical protein COA79_09570 [Planctomycetota bacterium]